MTATIKVTNISLKVTEKDIYDFFAFSGEIKYIQIGKEPDESKQYAYVTFHEERALDTALLLTDAVMADSHVIVEPAIGYVTPNVATSLPAPSISNQEATSKSTVSRAEDMIASMLAKGYILGVDTMSKAKTFDEKHRLTHTASMRASEIGGKASVTASNIDRRLGGISTKISAGATTVNQSILAFDRKYQLTEKTKGALTVAEQRINEAGSAFMRIQTVARGASWISSAFNRVAKVAEDVSVKTKQKVQKTEVERGSARPADQISMDTHPVPVSAPSPVNQSTVSASSLDSIPDKLPSPAEIQPDAKTDGLDKPSS